MAEQIVFALVFAALVGLVGMLWTLRGILWYLRGSEGIGVALVVKLVVAEVWMIVYLGALLINRFGHRDGLPMSVLLTLAVMLVLQPWLFLLWYHRWKRRKS